MDKKNQNEEEIFASVLPNNEDNIDDINPEDINDDEENQLKEEEYEDETNKKNKRLLSKRNVLVSVSVIIVIMLGFYFFSGDNSNDVQAGKTRQSTIKVPNIENKTPIVVPEDNKFDIKTNNTGNVLQDYNIPSNENDDILFDIENTNTVNNPHNSENINNSPLNNKNNDNGAGVLDFSKDNKTDVKNITVLDDENKNILKENNQMLKEILLRLDKINTLEVNQDQIKEILNGISSKECLTQESLDKTLIEKLKAYSITNSKIVANNTASKPKAKTVAKSNNYVKKENVSKTISKTKIKEKTPEKYVLASIMTDRFWITLPNGNTQSYGVGDILPNGQIVGYIDTNSGVFNGDGKLIITFN